MHTRIALKSPALARLIKEFEVQFKWLVTWLVFLVWHRRWRSWSGKLDPQQVKSVLFLRYDRIGDMVVSLPTFHLLKQRYPHLQIDVLASTGNRMMVEHDRAIRNVYVFDKSSLPATIATMRQLQEQRYDVTVDLVANVSATSLMMLLAAGRESFKIGVHKNNTIGLYDFIVPTTEHKTTQAVRLHFSALKPFGIDLEECRGDAGVDLPNEQWQRGRELISALRDDSDSGLVGINISAGKPNRDWGEERYREFLARLAPEYPGLRFIVFAAPADHARATAIAAHGGANVVAVPPGLSLLDVTAMIKQLDLIMTPDTSICHIASSLEIPLLGLYTAAEVNYQRWRPSGKRHWVLRPASGDSLFGISVESFLNLARQALDSIFQRRTVN